MNIKNKRTKGFIWSYWRQAITPDFPMSYVIYKGNFVKEIVLPNALKVTSMKKLHSHYYKYMKSHNGVFPESIRVNKRQYREYELLFHKYISGGKDSHSSPLTYQGIPLIINGKQ